MISIQIRDKTDLVKTTPACPGVYLFVNSKKEVIYVGKSKNLRRRLGQYANSKRLKKHEKMRKILGDATQVHLETCETALSAEILETRLIQKLRPKWNIAGAFHFLYPMIGLKASEGQILILYTTQPELFSDPEITFSGAFRSRFITKEAYLSLTYLLRLVGHQVKKKKSQVPAYSVSREFRRIPKEWTKELSAYFRGESKVFLENLVLQLLESPYARAHSAEIQKEIRNLVRFWKWEAVPLNRAFLSTGTLNYPISQKDRDIVFLKYRNLKNLQVPKNK